MTIEKFTAQVGADIKEFTRKMKQVDANIRKTASGANVNIGANVREFMRKMIQVRSQTSALNGSNSEVNIQADTSRFNRTVAMLKAKMLALSASKVVITVKANYQSISKMFSELKQGYQAGQAMMGKIATSMRNFGELVSTSFQGAFMAILPALSPILANVGALIGNLGVMIGVVGGQAIGFATSAGTAFIGFGGAVAMAVGNVKKLYEEGAKLNQQQKETKAAIDGIKKTYNDLVSVTEKPILNGVKTGATVASTLLRQLEPMFISVSNGFNTLMNSLKQSIGTPPVKQFIEYLNTTAGPMMVTFGKAVGNIFKALGSILVAFAPLSDSVSKGFLSMTESFAKWAQGLQQSEKFKSFMSYVQENMPKISSIFGNAILGVVNFFAAFGGSASGMMTSLQGLMQRWAQWTSQLSSNQAFQQFLSYVQQTAPTVMSLIGNLVTFLVNLGIAMAPLGAAIMVLVNNFLQWANGMMQTHPIIGQIMAVLISLTGVVMAFLPWILTIGTMFMKVISPIATFISNLLRINSSVSIVKNAFMILTRVFALLTGPIGLAVAVIGTIIAVLINVYQTSATFREQIATVFNAVKEVITTVFSAVKEFISSTWESIKSIWTDNSTQLQTIGTTLWNAIKTIVTTTMTVIMTIISTVWPAISTIIKTAWEVIKGVVTIGVALIKGIITVFLSVITGDWSKAWEAIKSTVSTIWNAIKATAVSVFGILKNFFVTLWNGIKSVTSSVWNGIKTFLSSTTNSIKNKFTSVFNAVKTFITTVWNAIKTTTNSVWNGIKTLISTVVNGIKSVITSVFNAIKSVVSRVWNSVKSLTNSVWNGIKSVISTIVNGIKSKITSTFNAIKSSISNIWNNIKSLTSNTWNNIKSSISNIVSSIKDAVTNKFTEMKTAVSDKVNEIKESVSDKFDQIKSFLSGIDLTTIGKNIMQGLLNGITAIGSRVVDKAKSIANSVKDTIAGALGIHSPSRVTTAQGEFTSIGLANGIANKKKLVEKRARQVAIAAKKSFNDNLRGLDLKLKAGTISTASYVKQAKELASKYKSVTNAQNTVNAKIAQATTKQAVATQKARNAKVIADQRKFNTKLAKLDNQYNASKKTNADTNKYVAKVKVLASQYKKNETIQNKANAKIISANKNVAANLLSTRKNTVSKLISSDKILTTKQLQSISKLAKEYPKNSKERIYFENQYSKAVKQNAKLQYEANKTKVENILANEKLSAAQQIAKIDEISKAYKKGSAERAYFDEQAGKKKKEIYDGLIALNDKYTNAIQEANKKLIDSEKALNAEYEKAVADRTKTLTGFTSLFAEVQKNAEVTSEQLKGNLQDQVTTLKEWASNINSLASKGVTGSLLEELQQLGPGASSEIAALNSMSEAELQEYVALWEEKSKVATNIATSELVGLRKDTDMQITALRAETAKQLALYNKEWQAEIKSLTGQTTNKFNALTASMPAIGANVIKGMQNGLTEMTPALLSQAEKIANTIKSTIQKALDIHSPSRWGDKFIGQNLVLGMINGIDRMKKKAIATALDLAESVKSEMASGLSVATGLGTVSEMKSSISKELQVKVKVELDGNGSAGGSSVVINNKYDTRHLSEAELARQQKRQLQQLGTQL